MLTIVEEMKQVWLQLAEAELQNWRNGYSPVSAYWADQHDTGR